MPWPRAPTTGCTRRPGTLPPGPERASAPTYSSMLSRVSFTFPFPGKIPLKGCFRSKQTTHQGMFKIPFCDWFSDSDTPGQLCLPTQGGREHFKGWGSRLFSLGKQVGPKTGIF